MEGKCCKCEEYGWEDPQEVVWISNATEAKGYCRWHAPSENKSMSDSDFVQLVFKRLTDYSKKSNSSIGKEFCCFTGTIFPGKLNFNDHAELLKNIIIAFNHCHFCQDVSFSGVEFQHTVFFKNSVFDGIADFSDAHFVKEVTFEQAVFNNTATYVNAKFAYNVSFMFATFNSLALFTSCTFLEQAHFFYTTFQNSVFISQSSASPASIQFHNIKSQSIQNISMSPLELHQYSFLGCEWPWKLHGGASEDLYRALKQKAAEDHNQPLVSRWHFREKLMQLKQLFNNERSNNLIEVVEDSDARWRDRAKAWFKLLWHGPHWPKLTLTGIYWATSGFGERAVRAGVWLLALVALSFLANSIKEPWVWAELPGSAAAGYTMATIPFAKDIPGDGWVKVGRGFWQLLIAVQFTLFALAVRNRFRR